MLYPEDPGLPEPAMHADDRSMSWVVTLRVHRLTGESD
jgi:hypothetical protein